MLFKCSCFNLHVLFYQEKPGELVDSRLDRGRIEVDESKELSQLAKPAFKNCPAETIVFTFV